MNYLFLNLKRFDISAELGGVNRLAPMESWAKTIIENTVGINAADGACFAAFFPETHLLNAARAAKESGSKMQIGCQGCARGDTAAGGNFGAFTSQLTANAAKQAGCGWALIGHCEERKKLEDIIIASGGDTSAVSGLLNAEVLCAQRAGLKVLYCIGEKAEQVDDMQRVLRSQLEEGLAGADPDGIVLAYEPVWAIGPGKTPPDRERIAQTSRYIKSVMPLPVVYGGGLKQSNAAMLASIDTIDGGLIALTRFSGEIGFYPDEYLEICGLFNEARS